MRLSVAVQMDPIERINIRGDSTFALLLEAQARRFDVEILSPQEALNLRIDGPYRHIKLSDGSEISCHALLLAMGVQWRTLDVPGMERLQGAGVYYGGGCCGLLSPNSDCSH